MDKTIEEIKSNGVRVWVEQNPNKLKFIKKLIVKYATAYYEGKALISDSDFEYLLDVVRVINPKDKILFTSGWGYKIKHGKKHKYGKVCSLDYYFNYDEFLKIFEGETNFIVTPKYDGVNFVAYFKNGAFKKCLTRGNGYRGKDISWAYNNVKEINCIEEKEYALSGEVILLEDVNSEIQFRDEVATYLSKNKIKMEDKIKFIPFSILNIENFNYLTILETINNFSNIKIEYKIYKNLPTYAEFKNLFKEFSSKYKIDGLVVSNFSKTKQIALKFKN